MSKAVAAEIKEAILKGKLSAGQRLTEKDLTASLGISRTPLREAFKELEAQGYLTLIPHRGAFVSQPSLDEVQDLYVIAGVLEGLAARLAAPRMSEEELERLQELYRSLDACHRRGDIDGYYHINHLFHQTFVEATGNRHLSALVESLRMQILKTRVLSLSVPDRLEESMREHEAILLAFRRRDAKGAEDRVMRHLQNQGRAFLSVMGRPGKGEGALPGRRDARGRRRGVRREKGALFG